MLAKLYAVNPWVAYGVSTLAILAAAELGRLVGVSRIRRAGSMSAEITTLQASMLALLALMIGFTFSMTLTLFEARRQAVLNEANAIRTTALRACLLPKPHASEVRKLLREYVQLRIDLLREPQDEVLLETTTRRSDDLQAQLWQQAVAVNTADPRANIALFVQSLNQTIDVQETRLFTARNRVPGVLFLLLDAVAVVAVGFSGFAVGLEGKQGHIPAAILGALVASVIGLIADIDRPRTGFITVSQQPLLDLQASLLGHALNSSCD
jgi:hypothetical protein